MKRGTLIVLLGCLLAAAAGLALWLLLKPASARLERVPFAIVSGKALRYDPTRFQWQSGEKRVRAGGAIADGRGVAFSKNAELRATPLRTGKAVVYFSYSVMPSLKGSVRVAIVHRQRGREATLRAFAVKERSSGYFSAVLKLERGDTIGMKAAGRGFLIAGQALIAGVAEPERRQYVFIVAPDTFRGDRLEKRGGSALKFPNLEEFARDAVLFENAVAPSSWTLPSFASIFSAQYEFRHQVTPQSPLSPDKPHLLASLRPRFATIQYNDGVWLSAKMGLARNHDGFFTSSRVRDVYADRLLFANARSFLEANPFPALFMFLHTYKLHSPFEPGPEFFAALDPKPQQSSMGTYSNKAQFHSEVPAAERQAMEKLYDAEVLQFDHYFGGFIRYLKQAGIYERSLIVLLSDHGEEFAEHGGWFHGHSLYREIYHVPFYIKFPDKSYAGRRCPEFVSMCDVLPTVLDHLRIACPQGIDGISLLPLIRGSRLRPRAIFSSTTASLFNAYLPQRFSIFSGPYHLIFNSPMPPQALAYYQEYGQPRPRPEIELYDTRSDPGELREISLRNPRVIDSLRPEIVRILKLIRGRKKTGEVGGSLLDEEQDSLRTLGYL
jgi:arylsulfatase A-like enzyme